MMDDWEILDLSSDDPCRTTLVNRETQAVSFTAITEDKQAGSKPLTTFSDGDGNVVAKLEWHMYLSDKLSIRGGKIIGVGKWFTSKKGIKDAVSFTCTSGNKYFWKGIDQRSTLWLYPDTDNENAIGAFQPRGKKALITDPPPPAPFLQLSHHTKVDRDEILVALLLIEKARRFGKKVTANSFGDALFFGGIGSGFTGSF